MKSESHSVRFRLRMRHSCRFRSDCVVQQNREGWIFTVRSLIHRYTKLTGVCVVPNTLSNLILPIVPFVLYILYVVYIPQDIPIPIHVRESKTLKTTINYI